MKIISGGKMRRPKKYPYSRSIYELVDVQVVYRYVDCEPVGVEYVYVNRFTQEVVQKFQKV